MRLKNFFENGHDPLPLPTNAEIEQAKAECERAGLYEGWRGRYRAGDRTPLHQHPDCIRMAFAWLDAQRAVGYIPPACDFKHLIEEWAGRYVSRSDTIVAAHLHPRIEGAYPRFNISTRLIMPDTSRLIGLEANIHGYTGADKDYFGFETTAARCRLDGKTPAGGDAQAGADATGPTGEHDNAGAQSAESSIPQRSSDVNVFLRPVRPAGGAA